MNEENIWFVVKKKAVPEVLLKVVEAKRLLKTHRALTVQEAAAAVGISRSSFYKYQDDVMEFHDTTQGTILTLTVQMNDEPGLLSEVLKTIADYGGNILTIHQSIPVNGTASLSISVQFTGQPGDVPSMLSSMEEKPGVHYVQVLAKE